MIDNVVRIELTYPALPEGMRASISAAMSQHHVAEYVAQSLVNKLNYEIRKTIRKEYPRVSSSGRGTGRTTRMLHRVLGDDSRVIYITAHNHYYAEQLARDLRRMDPSLQGTSTHLTRYMNGQQYIFRSADSVPTRGPGAVEGPVYEDHYVSERFSA